MIVEVGFLDHWKTRRLVELAGDDERVVLALLRLWEFCQTRRKCRFTLSDEAFDSICRLQQARKLLLAAGFLDEGPEGIIIVHDWHESNARLITSWKNGSKGGRPPKPVGSLGLAQGKPKRTRPSSLSSLSSPSNLSSQNGEVQGEETKLAYPHGITDSEWIATLKADKTYAGIDIDREHGKMMAWCNTNEKNPSRRRFVNWLNRAEKPMSPQTKPQRKELPFSPL